MNTTFLRECKDITINLANDTQKEFVMDLLTQTILNDFNYEYNGEILNIIDLNSVGGNGIHIVLQGATKIEKPQPRIKKIDERKHNGKKKLHGNIVITGAMPVRKRHQYNIKIDERYADINQICECLGLTHQAIYSWIRRGWARCEVK